MNAYETNFKQAMELNRMAFKMKQVGWLVDQAARAVHQKRLEQIILESKEKFRELTQIPLEEINTETEGEVEEDDDSIFNSSKQLQELFYETLGCRRRINPKSGRPTLDKNVLKDIIAEGPGDVAKAAARILLTFREAHKTFSTYVRKLDPSNVDAKGNPNTYLTRDQFLRADWAVVQAATGRWSCRSPNLQNIQKPVTGKDKDGKKIIVRAGMRDMLTARPGNRLVEGDYSQLELRIIALLSGDQILLEMFEQEGVDIHTENAKILLGVTEPSAGERNLAKVFVYGSNYGGSAKIIWKQMVVQFPKLTLPDVQRMQERWFAVHHWIRTFQQKTNAEARATGRVTEVLSGRIFPFFLGQVIPTEPPNYLVQGFAATLMNRAMVKLDRALNWTTQYCLAQVHDAAIVEGPDHVELGRILKATLPQEAEYGGRRASFPIDLKYGPSWGEMTELHV